ncbi:dihydroneopterin triphosphate diphosphatase [Alteromonadaceae bacterium M269]|nr:dihydroneopterin triphosphate diphosphatase [Alteromonadaceae bacterium M269]
MVKGHSQQTGTFKDGRYKRAESVLVLIHDKDQHVLLLQRDDDPLFWQSVTGTMEGDETPTETALREVFEETGIDIQAKGYQLVDCRHTSQYEIRERWLHRYPPGTKFNTEYCFALSVERTDHIKLTEHLAFGWYSKEEAIKKAWSDSNKQAIEKFV